MSLATVHDFLSEQLKRSLTGWARVSVKDAWHLFGPSSNKHYLQACSHTSLLPVYGAKLKERHELPTDAKVCSDCERRAR